MKLGTGINQLLQLSLVVFSISLAACQVGAAENEVSRDAAQVTQPTQVEPAVRAERIVQVQQVEQAERVVQVQRAEQAERIARVQQVLQAERVVQVQRAEQAERAAQVRQVEQVDRAMLLLAQASQVQQQDDARRLRGDAIRKEQQFRRLQEELSLKRVDFENRAREFETRVRESINVEEIRRTVAASMEQLRLSRAEVDVLIGEDGSINAEQINRITARALSEVQRQLESIDFAQLEKDLELSLEILRENLQGLDLDMESLLEDVDNLTTQFGAPPTPSEVVPVPPVPAPEPDTVR